MKHTLNLRPGRVGAVVLATGVIALAGCSSSSSSSTSKDTKSSSTSSTSKASGSTSSAGSGGTTRCATRAQATAALGGSGTATGAPYCVGTYAAGSATNGQVDFAYLLVLENGTWAKASDAVQQEVCTTNPNHLPQQLVDDACND